MFGCVTALKSGKEREFQDSLPLNKWNVINRLGVMVRVKKKGNGLMTVALPE